MRSLNPPFRADHVGSLLRPRRLLDARTRFHKNEITKAQLRAAEDDAIRDLVTKEEAAGLCSITDGEYRRTFFHTDFLQRLQGVAITGGIATKFHTHTGEIDFAPPRIVVTGKLRHVEDIQRDDFEFLKIGGDEHAKGHGSVADDGPFPRRPEGHRHPRVSGSR